MSHKGEILILKEGLIVTVDMERDGSDSHPYRARPLWAPPGIPYKPGGHDIVLSDRDIAQARTVTLTDELAAALVAASEPTYEAGLVVIGEKFKAPRPDDESENVEELLWTIAEEENYWMFRCIAENGEAARFDYRKIAHHRTLHRFIESMERRRAEREAHTQLPA